VYNALGKERRMRSLLVVAMLAAVAASVDNPEPDWGPASGGLRMAISWLNPAATTAPDTEFRIAFQNIGSKDVVLNLGYTVGASPPPQQLSAIRLTVTDSKGRTTEFPMEKTIFVGGQFHEITARLPAGETYVRQFALAQCCFLKRGILEIAGRYRISACFEGRAEPWSTGQFQAPSNVWIGTLQSNSAPFDLLAPPL
jgi:hypothetical protein